MTRDPLLPVRLVDGVWTTDGAGSAAVPIEHHPGIMTPMTWPTPAPKATGSADCSLGLSSSEAQFWAAITDEQRTVFAAVALDGSGVWAIGDTEADARSLAVDRREDLRERGDDDFPAASTDAAWSAALAIVTLSGATENLRLLVTALGDEVALWSPDLWTDPESAKEP